MRRRGLAGLLIAVMVTATACTATSTGPTGPDGARPPVTAGPASVVAPLPVERVAAPQPMRLAAGLAPPTNRWYSGLVFGDAPKPVYPFPLAFSADDAGFALSLPDVAVAEKTIGASFGGGLTVDAGATGFEVVRADPVSVTMRFSDATAPVGDVTIAEGWPVVGFTAARDATLRTPAALSPAGDGVWTTHADGVEYGVVAPGSSSDGATLTVPSGRTAQWFAVPSDGDLHAWAAALKDPVDAVSTSYRLGDDTATTTLGYTSEGTVLVGFPPYDTGCSDPKLGTFDTPYGTASACAAPRLAWSVPRLQARDRYDFAALPADAREKLAAQGAADLAATKPLPADTYFGGKALARLGSMLTIADAIGDDELVDAIADRLWSELQPWVDADGCRTQDAHCFVYDDALHLVVGKTPSFGSEEANDHHFHYGYFLAAASALASVRPELADRMAPVIDALAADIATGAADEALPALRVFDPYRGHSWASGFSPFADGNNQESTSEAVNAWNGLALWAKVRGDDALGAEATWLLSAEAAAARALWLEPDDLPDGYAHGIVSLTWGAKRDYATWFSPEPSAILGIQALPVGPVSLEYLASSPKRVAANVAEAGGVSAFGATLGDYVLLYSALGGPDATARASAAAGALDPAGLDDGLSMSAVLAWLDAVRLSESG